MRIKNPDTFMLGIAVGLFLAYALLWALKAHAEVVIWVNNAPVPVGCPAPPPAVVMNRAKDGTPVYTREAITSQTLQMCYVYPVSRREVWTDYPEKGGEFIRVERDEKK